MQVYKALRPFSVLSFDLDDTLYDNKPVIAAAEQAMLEALAELTPVSQATDSHFWWQQRVKLAHVEPEIRHDIGRWRLLGGLADRAAGGQRHHRLHRVRPRRPLPVHRGVPGLSRALAGAGGHGAGVSAWQGLGLQSRA